MTDRTTVPGETARRTTFVMLFALAVILAPFLVWTWSYFEDDAYIHCQFARHVLERGEFAFNAGVRVLGDTAPAWVVLLSLLGGCGIPFVAASKVLSFLSVLGCAWICDRIVAHAVAPRAWSGMDRLWLAATFVAHPFILATVPTGMETTMAMLIMLALVLMFERAFASTKPLSLPRCFVLGVMSAAASLFRPELILIGACASLALAAARFRASAQPRNVIAETAAVLVPWGAAGLTIAAALAIHFGSPIPTTLGAKSYGAGGTVLLSLQRTVEVLLFGYLLPCLALGVLLFARRQSPAAVLSRVPHGYALWVAVTLAGYIVLQVRVQTRYAVMFWPLCLVCLGIVLAGAGPVHRRRFAQVLCLAGLLAQSACTVLPALANRLANDRETDRLVACVKEKTASNAVIGVYAIGKMGFLSERRVADFGGIATPELLAGAPRERWRKAVDLGMTHVLLLSPEVARLGIPDREILCSVTVRPSTWILTVVRPGGNATECLVPVSSIDASRQVPGESGP